MNVVELLLIAVGLSMDAFAVSVGMGMMTRKRSLRAAAIPALYFGGFQALMPLVGYVLGAQLASPIARFDHWIAFALLSFIGGRMVLGALQPGGCNDRDCPEALRCADRSCPAGGPAEHREPSLGFRAMLPLAVATSIDALAVGISFAFLSVDIVPAISAIGAITFAFSFAGVKLGGLFRSRWRSWAELLGGAILIFLGVKILFEHLGILAR